MSREESLSDMQESFFSHRMARLMDRFDDWQRHARHPQELLYKYRAKRQAASLMSRPELREACEIAREEGARGDPETWRKYLNIERYIMLNLRRVYSLGLHDCRPLSVLDIGAGAGFFLYVCKLYGHEVIGFDSNQGNFYQKIHAALNVPCLCSRVLPLTPLPEFQKKFDLITAFAVCFHEADGRKWSKEEWRFFYIDLLDNHCKDDGRIHLHLNDSPRGDRKDVCQKITASFPTASLDYHSVDLFRA
ncbi:class I SAM-dependent methyltransferase, partial [Desulfovibrio sp. OttesenSCG-928-G11]|nr:class I SAM-dependent methyltransferase [Desulfovibrio sp. OttesenSCG-928-G11]